MACRPGMPNVPGRTDQYFDPETKEIYPAGPDGGPDCSKESTQTLDGDTTTPTGGSLIGAQLKALADALGVDINGLNEALGLSEYQKGLYKDFQGYLQPQLDALKPYLSGINPALESLIAGQRNAATDRISGGLADRGTVNSGIRAVLEGRASREATSQTAQARLGTQQMGLAGMAQVSGQAGSFLSNMLNARSPLDRLLAGMSGTGMWKSDQLNQSQTPQNLTFDFGDLFGDQQQDDGGNKQQGGGFHCLEDGRPCNMSIPGKCTCQ